MIFNCQVHILLELGFPDGCVGYNSIKMKQVSSFHALRDRLAIALHARRNLLDESWETALRLFNGFYEGCPELVVDLYGRTLVFFNYADSPDEFAPLVVMAQSWFLEKLPGIESVLVKTRKSANLSERQGVLTFGETVARKVREQGVWYALDLQMNQDASFYLDTRLLRRWMKENAAGKTVLNTFAYTGSLGAAALAGGAARVVQTDLNRNYLNLAKTTCTLNGFPIRKADFLTNDFYRQAAIFKQAGQLFDLVILDAPYFSVTQAGRVDLIHEFEKLINKLRPLVAHQGRLVAINNALFLSGAELMDTIQSICAGGYVHLEQTISVPDDITGYPETRVSLPPADPAPFNHPTKISVLRVTRKDERTSNTALG